MIWSLQCPGSAFLLRILVLFMLMFASSFVSFNIYGPLLLFVSVNISLKEIAHLHVIINLVHRGQLCKDKQKK
jgi:hypothetical protein